MNGDLNWMTNFIWGIADDVLRDLYVRGEYRDVILPMTVLRRLDAADGKELTRRGFENIKGREGNGRRGITLIPRSDPTSPEFYFRTPTGLEELEGDMRPN